MKPSEVRAHVLSDHDELRRELDRLEVRTRCLLRGDSNKGGVPELRRDATGLLQRLGVHMSWEERYLVPSLHDTDSWGPARAERLLCEHREQREQLEFLLGRLRDEKRADALVFSDVQEMICWLREDMLEEEQELLGEDVLRDDVIGVNVDAG